LILDILNIFVRIYKYICLYLIYIPEITSKHVFSF